MYAVEAIEYIRVAAAYVFTESKWHLIFRV